MMAGSGQRLKPPNPAVAGFRSSSLDRETPRRCGCKNLSYRRKPVWTVVSGREFRNLDSGVRRNDEHGCIMFISLLR